MAGTRTAELVRPSVGEATLLACWRLPSGPAAASTARLLLRGALGALGLVGEAVEDAELMVSELVTNAIIHASRPCALRLHGAMDVVFCEVLDGTPGPAVLGDAVLTSRPILAADGEIPESGRGLSLVRRLSAGQCGSRRLTDAAAGGYAKGVWFALPGPG